MKENIYFVFFKKSNKIQITNKSFIFYLGITSLGNNFNPYTMFMLSCIGEFIGYSICFLNDKFSRKKVMIIFLMSATLFCLLASLSPKELDGQTTWRSFLTIFFATAGKAAASASFNSIFVYTFRMFPTNVRNTLFALCNSIGKIGSLLSPQINVLRTLVWEPLPYFVFSSSAVIASFVLFFLPDPSKLTF